MKKKPIIVCLIVFVSVVSAFAYLPIHWNKERAAFDFQKANAVVIARVVELKRISYPKEDNYFMYTATFSVGRVIRGPLRVHDSFSFAIGGYPPRPGSGDSVPTGLLLHNSQNGYSVDINGVYLLCLMKTGDNEWLPRSGPYSIFKVGRRDRVLLVDTRNNREFGHENRVRRLKDQDDHSILLEDFLKNKMKKEDAQPKDSSDKP